MHYWTKQKMHLGLPVDADMFTLEVVEVFGQKMLAEYEDKDADIDVKTPDKFIISSNGLSPRKDFRPISILRKGMAPSLFHM